MSERLALVLAMTFPRLMEWLEFIVLHGDSDEKNPILIVTFILGKVVLVAFPVLFMAWHDRSQLRLSRPTSRGIGLGLAFGTVTGLAALGLYFFVLRDTSLFAATGALTKTWFAKLGIGSIASFVFFGTFICVVHSLIEEYYWRWFVFGRLRHWLPWSWAAVVSGLAFTSHHVILLNKFLPGYFWVGVVPFSLGVAVGGMAWAWLYQRSQSIYGTWASHFLIDAALMVVIYDLLIRK